MRAPIFGTVVILSTVRAAGRISAARFANRLLRNDDGLRLRHTLLLQCSIPFSALHNGWPSAT
jgi:hypothetical protein